MINRVATHIVEELNDYIGLLSSGSGEHVIAASLFDIDGVANANVKDKIVLSLVNLEQDKTYQSVEKFQKDANGLSKVVKPEIKINLHFLVSANFTIYEESLKAISRVIAFFQHRQVFNIPKFSEPSPNHSRVVFEIVSMSFEQQNHLWGSLGGKYIPSVVYKAGLVEIQDERTEAMAALVQEIKVNE